MLGVGFACSLLGIGDLGSLIALIIGLRALRVIKQSNGEITGRVMAWWCTIMGALGVLVIPPLIIQMVIQQLP